MVDKGDIGGLAGGVVAGGLAAKLVGGSIMTTILGPAYVIGATLVGYYLGHNVAHNLVGSKSH